MGRFLALLLVLFPVVLSSIGIKFIRDSLFLIRNSPIPFLWLQFLLGIIFLIGALSLIGGFIFYRDKKRNKVRSSNKSTSVRNSRF